ERDVVQQYRGESVVLEFHEKVRIEMACSEAFVEPTIRAICATAQTGEVGDGKIFVLPLDDCIRIRTGERGPDAI
ncbi:MAG: P-II family nitrogen regulator, partial [Isosphaeraceae bacterium]